MKKILLVPLFAAMALVSQALAASAECTSGNKAMYYLCAWDSPILNANCRKLDADPAESQTCASRATACPGLRQVSAADLAGMTQSGTGYDCTGLATVSGTPNFDSLEDVGEGECKNGGTKQVFCQQSWGCMALDTRYSSIGDGDAATCKPAGPRCTCSQLVADCPAGQLYVDVNKATMPDNGNGQQCTAYSGVLAGGSAPGSSSGGGTPSSSSGGTDPIISYSSAPAIGLSVAHFASSLRIASGKDAAVSLFDLHGRQVFSQKVLRGTTTISLERHRQGVYYAVVTSGSQKQTVKVVLK